MSSYRTFRAIFLTIDHSTRHTHVENNVCSNVIYRTVSAISVSIPPVRHALVTTVELKYLNCRHSNVRIGGIRDNNVTFYMGSNTLEIKI